MCDAYAGRVFLILHVGTCLTIIVLVATGKISLFFYLSVSQNSVKSHLICMLKNAARVHRLPRMDLFVFQSHMSLTCPPSP